MATIIGAYFPMGDPEFLDNLVSNFDSFCQDYPWVKTQELPMLFMASTCPVKMEKPTY